MERVHVPAGMRRYPRARPPWGPKNTLIAIAVNVGGILALSGVVAAIIFAADTEFDSLSDAEDWVVVMFVGLTLVQQAVTGGGALWALRTRWDRMVEALGWNRYDWTQLWRPALMTIALYGGVIIYSVIMTWLDIDLLEPESTVDEDFVRGPILVAGSFLMICVGAPLSEEIVFRGAIFGGLLKWGFWPAAVISGFLFSAVHLDPGSLIPFWIVGIGLAWLYWSRGSLWDAIICHAMFNFSSYLLLISGET
jgi:membrane protease YdiL (CAAX protease family)